MSDATDAVVIWHRLLCWLCCTVADARHDALFNISSSESRCPFAGSGSTALPDQDTASTSASDGGNPLGLSVSLPPREYLPFRDETYKIDLRFERITLDDIFEIDEEYEADLIRKKNILATRPADLLLPGVPGVSLCSLSLSPISSYSPATSISHQTHALGLKVIVCLMASCSYDVALQVGSCRCRASCCAHTLMLCRLTPASPVHLQCACSA